MNKYLSNPRSIIIFTFPAVFLFGTIILMPIGRSIVMGFYNWNGLVIKGFAGIHNYIKLFKDPDFFLSIKNSLIFMSVIGLYQIGFGFLLAALLSSGKIGRGKKFYRIAVFIPTVLSVAVICQLWKSVFDGQNGLLNTLFKFLNIDFQQDWLGNYKTSIYLISFVNAWQFIGYHFLLFYTAMQSIPKSIYESAYLDGAGFFLTQLKITMPLMKETFKISLILIVTSGFKAFEHIYIMTKGGPGTASYTQPMLMYRAMFRLHDFGYGSTIATVLLLECLLSTLLINRLFGKERITY